ncbi:MAG: hypothetical protein ABIH23_07435, partial [bacterium]
MLSYSSRCSVWCLLIAVSCFAAVPIARSETEWTVGDARLVCDLVDAFSKGTVDNALDSNASQQQVCGGQTQTVPGIFLHPLDEGEATWRLSLELPTTRPDEKLVFLGLVGLRDGIPWNDSSKPQCNGVEFIVRIGEVTCLHTSVLGPGWKPIQVDLTQFQGQQIEIVLATSARNNANYDWATFGRPEILLLSGRRSVTEEESQGPGLRFLTGTETSGVIIAEVIEPDTPAKLTMSRTGFSLLPDTSIAEAEKGWVARRFATPVGDETVEIANLAAMPSYCEVYHFLPTVEIEEFGPITAVPLLGKNVFAVRIINKGPGYYRPDGEPLEFRVFDAHDSSGRIWEKFVTEGPPKLAPGESVILRRGPFEITDDFPYCLRASLPKQSASATIMPYFYPDPQPGAVALTCGDYRISFPKFGRLYPAAVIEHVDEKSKKTHHVGTIYPLTSATTRYSGGLSTRNLVRDTIEWVGERELIISESFTSDGRPVKLSVRFTSEPEQSLIRFSSTIEISQGEMEVYNFSGPRIAFGDGSFGAKHGYALFPGLEYLGPEGHSSSNLDAWDPIAQRGAPDPIKITIPLMAVEHGKDLACMFWDPHQEWQAGQKMPGAQFDVPPADGLNEYSSFSLYVPPPPDWRPENSKIATKPVILTPEKPITLNGTIYLDNADNVDRYGTTKDLLDGEFIFASLIKYMMAVGIPHLGDPPRDWETEKALSREAWLSTIWVPEEKGWRHCAGKSWRPAPAPGAATLALFDYFDTPDPAIRAQLKERIEEAIGSAIETRGPGYLSSGDNCHIMRGEYPFYGGYLRQALEQWIAAGLTLMKEQREDGSWGWNPGSDQRCQNLGIPGQTTNGICAGSAFFLLKLGRVLGDDQFIQAGLKGLEALERDRVPRGAQGWECPLHAPDILASAYAIRANVEAYRATGDVKYVDQARYWVWSGLPFIYLWGIDSIPSMQYNTIPIFGATFYTHSWFGRPVVWCGLVYAYAVQELDRLDTKCDWEPFAKGITFSSMLQQYEFDHKSKGCYPDSFDLRLNKRIPADINPEDIMVNAFTLRGMDPGIKTLRFAYDNRTITVSSGAQIERIPIEQGLSMTLSFFEGETAYTLVAPMQKVSRVLEGDRELPRV